MNLFEFGRFDLLRPEESNETKSKRSAQGTEGTGPVDIRP